MLEIKDFHLEDFLRGNCIIKCKTKEECKELITTLHNKNIKINEFFPNEESRYFMYLDGFVIDSTIINDNLLIQYKRVCSINEF